MSGWENFLLAEVGASAALLGLIFLGVSINLSRILAIPRMPARASYALGLLVGVLVLSSLLLVPAQSTTAAGLEVLVVGLILWGSAIRLDVTAWRESETKYRGFVSQNAVFNQITTLPYVIAGVVMLIQGYDGLYWLVPAVILSFGKAILDSWVLLVEINR